MLAWINLADEETQVSVSGNIYHGTSHEDDPDEVADLKVTIPDSGRDLSNIIDDATYEDLQNQLYNNYCKH
jgi:hypothetical protein